MIEIKATIIIEVELAAGWAAGRVPLPGESSDYAMKKLVDICADPKNVLRVTELLMESRAGSYADVQVIKLP
jgi:hypothetical protein